MKLKETSFSLQHAERDSQFIGAREAKEELEERSKKKFLDLFYLTFSTDASIMFVVSPLFSSGIFVSKADGRVITGKK